MITSSSAPGSAGCVLADRLSACGRHKVLLIEAGGSDRRFWIKVPLGYARTFRARAVNWRYTAAADPGLGGRQAYWPRGRVIGGSSSINAMAYLRGPAAGFRRLGGGGRDRLGLGQCARDLRGDGNPPATGRRREGPRARRGAGRGQRSQRPDAPVHPPFPRRRPADGLAGARRRACRATAKASRRSTAPCATVGGGPRPMRICARHSGGPTCG